MAIADVIIEYIASHLWATIVLAILYIAYEIIIRRMPTDSPYWSIAHTIGKGIKLVGKAVIKIIGENISKKAETDDEGKPIVTPTGKPKRRRHE
jgi:hypothetical protein